MLTHARIKENSPQYAPGATVSRSRTCIYEFTELNLLNFLNRVLIPHLHVYGLGKRLFASVDFGMVSRG